MMMAAFMPCWNCIGGLIDCSGDVCKCDKCGFNLDQFWNDGAGDHLTE